MKKPINQLLQQSDIFTSLDLHFASFIQRLDGRSNDAVYLAAALLSRGNRQGHICVDLTVLAGVTWVSADQSMELTCPALEDWVGALRSSPAVGRPGEFKPLVLDNRHKLYLHRYWEYQERLAANILGRAARKSESLNLDRVRELLDRYFAPVTDTEIDWQRAAAMTALHQDFCVISGGPGTGKTTTIAKMMAFLLDYFASQSLRIALAAPTGKAAMRLQEAIRLTKRQLPCSEKIKMQIPEGAATIHRLLGAIPNSPFFRHQAQNPLPVDIMIVDEASMVDLALMAKLVQALPNSAKLILVGDKDQLASVEAGAVLGDICDTGNSHPYSTTFYQQLADVSARPALLPAANDEAAGLQDCIIQLQKSFRFGHDSGIGAVSRAVNRGDGLAALQILQRAEFPDAQWVNLPLPQALAGQLKEQIITNYRPYLQAETPLEAFIRFDRFRVLCALREGPYGVATINTIIENTLQDARLIRQDRTWYAGRPVMISVNNYELNLFNGDVGIVLPDPEAHGELRVFFMAADQTLRKFHPLRLPPHETIYAMTVHKSQGSEFDQVLLLLPDRESPVITRELIYTGITRARNRVAV
ncbi:MAG: exodeoxyribonuclease V subunit alpha, partial [candidate division KSB1 bacterium]|nr:exodeoxyribonuclease V subunit alpha [candidate division KSB1 bacterium]